MAKKAVAEAKAKPQVKTAEKPKRLSKTGEWMRANPGGVIVIHDLKAVLK